MLLIENGRPYILDTIQSSSCLYLISNMEEVNMISSTQVSSDSETITVRPQTQTERLEIPLRQATGTDAFRPEIAQNSAKRR
jgi:hypothetical protein